MIKRLLRLSKRRLRARELGFPFRRAAGFTIPSEIKIGSKRLHLRLPKDDGTGTAFIDVLLDDCYGIWGLPDDVQTVLDIGAHVGLFSIAARERWPKAMIHAYEPNAALKIYSDHHAAQAEFCMKWEAVSLSRASVVLLPHADSVQVRTAEQKGGNINQVSFRDAVARVSRDVDLVKLDCEGAEWKILQDGNSWERIRFLTMEFHLWAGYSLKELKMAVSRLGFHVRHAQMTGTNFGILRASK